MSALSLRAATYVVRSAPRSGCTRACEARSLARREQPRACPGPEQFSLKPCARVQGARPRYASAGGRPRRTATRASECRRGRAHDRVQARGHTLQHHFVCARCLTAALRSVRTRTEAWGPSAVPSCSHCYSLPATLSPPSLRLGSKSTVSAPAVDVRTSGRCQRVCVDHLSARAQLQPPQDFFLTRHRSPSGFPIWLRGAG